MAQLDKFQNLKRYLQMIKDETERKPLATAK